MDVSKAEAIDAIDDLLSDLQGASEALSLFGAAEGLDLPTMVSRALVLTPWMLSFPRPMTLEALPRRFRLLLRWMTAASCACFPRARRRRAHFA